MEDGLPGFVALTHSAKNTDWSVLYYHGLRNTLTDLGGDCMDTQARIVVTGMGTVNPIGLSVDAFWKGMMGGESGAAPITHFDASDFKTRFACELKGFDPLNYIERKQAARLDSFCHYALAASQQAVEDAQLNPADRSQAARDRMGVVFGSGIGGLQVLETQAKVLAEKGANSLSPPKPLITSFNSW